MGRRRNTRRRLDFTSPYFLLPVTPQLQGNALQRRAPMKASMSTSLRITRKMAPKQPRLAQKGKNQGPHHTTSKRPLSATRDTQNCLLSASRDTHKSPTTHYFSQVRLKAVTTLIRLKADYFSQGRLKAVTTHQTQS